MRARGARSGGGLHTVCGVCCGCKQHDVNAAFDFVGRNFINRNFIIVDVVGEHAVKRAIIVNVEERIYARHDGYNVSGRTFFLDIIFCKFRENV